LINDEQIKTNIAYKLADYHNKEFNKYNKFLSGQYESSICKNSPYESFDKPERHGHDKNDTSNIKNDMKMFESSNLEKIVVVNSEIDNNICSQKTAVNLQKLELTKPEERSRSRENESANESFKEKLNPKQKYKPKLVKNEEKKEKKNKNQVEKVEQKAKEIKKLVTSSTTTNLLFNKDASTSIKNLFESCNKDFEHKEIISIEKNCEDTSFPLKELSSKNLEENSFKKIKLIMDKEEEIGDLDFNLKKEKKIEKDKCKLKKESDKSDKINRYQKFKKVKKNKKLEEIKEDQNFSSRKEFFQIFQVSK